MCCLLHAWPPPKPINRDLHLFIISHISKGQQRVKKVSILDEDYCHRDMMKTLQDQFKVKEFKTKPLILCVGMNITVKRSFYEMEANGSSNVKKIEPNNKDLVKMDGHKFEDWYISAPGK